MKLALMITIPLILLSINFGMAQENARLSQEAQEFLTQKLKKTLLPLNREAKEIGPNHPQYKKIENYLAAGADPNGTVIFQEVDNRQKSWQVPFLHWLIKKKQYHLFQLFLRYQANPNAVDGKRKETALHQLLTITENSHELQSWLLPLLGAGIDLDTPNFAGKTALHLAIAGNKIPWVEALLAAGSNPNHSEKKFFHDPPLVLATELRRTEILQLLLQYGANPNSTSLLGKTPLGAAEYNTYKVRNSLVSEIEKLLKDHPKQRKSLKKLHQQASQVQDLRKVMEILSQYDQKYTLPQVPRMQNLVRRGLSDFKHRKLLREAGATPTAEKAQQLQNYIHITQEPHVFTNFGGPQMYFLSHLPGTIPRSLFQLFYTNNHDNDAGNGLYLATGTTTSAEFLGAHLPHITQITAPPHTPFIDLTSTNPQIYAQTGLTKREILKNGPKILYHYSDTELRPYWVAKGPLNLQVRPMTPKNISPETVLPDQEILRKKWAFWGERKRLTEFGPPLIRAFNKLLPVWFQQLESTCHGTRKTPLLLPLDDPTSLITLKLSLINIEDGAEEKKALYQLDFDSKYRPVCYEYRITSSIGKFGRKLVRRKTKMSHCSQLKPDID
jgi:hypothetical protein